MASSLLTNFQLNIDAPQGEDTLFADIALPVPIPRLFTYRVPAEISEVICPGVRVIVQFGKKKVVTGIVENLHHNPPDVYVAKPILELLDTEPMVTERQMATMRWLASYYMCTLGEVVNAALPSGLKLSSESRIQLHPDHDWKQSEYPFDDRELIILNALENNDSLTYREAADLMALKSAYRYIKSLVQKEVIIIYEEVREKYKPKRLKKIRLTPKFAQDEEALEVLFAQLEKRPKQTDILLKYLQEVPIFQEPERNAAGIEKSLIAKSGLSTSSLRTLLKNNIFEEFEEIISRFEAVDMGN